MAHHKSAIKRIRQTITRAERNRSGRTKVKNTIRAFREACDAKTNTADQLNNAISVVAAAASKGFIPAKRASRKISRLAKAANRAQA